MRLILLFLTFLHLSCSSPQIVVDDRRLGIIVDDDQLDVTATIKDRELLTFDRLRITQTRHLLRSGAVIVVEKARTIPAYQFKDDTRRSLDIIFDAHHVTRLDRIGNLGFYEVTPKSNEGILYVIAQNINKSAITMLYGLSKEQMSHAMAHVGSEAIDTLETSAEAILLSNTKDAFQSRWSDKMLIIEGLLMRVGGRPRGSVH